MEEHVHGFALGHCQHGLFPELATNNFPLFQTRSYQVRDSFLPTVRRLQCRVIQVTQTLLHTDSFTHRRFYTQTLFTHRTFYTQTLFTHRTFYTQTLLHTDPFTHRPFYTQKLLHTEAFTHRRFYIQTLLHTDPFTHRSFYTQTLSHTETGPVKSQFYFSF